MTDQLISLFNIHLREDVFELDASFLAKYVLRPVNWGPVGEVTYRRTYSRYQDPEHAGGAHRSVRLGEYEDWWQTVARVVEGTYQIQQRHCAHNHVPWDRDVARRSAEDMYERMFTFKFLPPGRGLWMMGTSYIRRHGSAALNNCAFVTTEGLEKNFANPFAFLMDMCMLGVGVGSDTRGAGSFDIKAPGRATGPVFYIEDSREGWVEALGLALLPYRTGEPRWVFDYSKVRERGAPIRGFGGRAEGPDPLRKLLEEDIPAILDPLAGKPITSSAIVDIFNVIGKCVVAGNVRRSAEIMFGDPDDQAFLDLKDPDVNQWAMMNHRWASNNSIFAEVGMDYRPAVERIVKRGEPGFFWLKAARKYGRMIDDPTWDDHRVMGANPCVEQSLEDHELCCLVETFPAHHDSYADFQRTLKRAYLYAKTVTLVPTHNAKTNEVMERNRRIGTSQSGVIQSFNKIGRREHLNWCDRGYDFLRVLDDQYSEWMQIPKSNKVTSVKPSGTVSKLCGASSGIHYPPAKYYIQRIRIADGHPLIADLTAKGHYIEDCVYGGSGTKVVQFLVEEEHFSKAEGEATLWEQLANAAAMQKYWADNQVSCTVKFYNTPHPEITAPIDRSIAELENQHADATVAIEELKALRARMDEEARANAEIELVAALETFEDQLKGVSFLPHAHGYQQAPWEPVTEAEFFRLQGEQDTRARAHLHPELTRKHVAMHDSEDKFCDSASCAFDISEMPDD